VRMDSTTYSSDLNQRRVPCSADLEERPRSSMLAIAVEAGSVAGFFDFTLSVTPQMIDERQAK
jgi:hypothetical protein